MSLTQSLFNRLELPENHPFIWPPCTVTQYKSEFMMGFQYHGADPVLTGTHGHRNLWWMYNLICCCRLYLRCRWVGTKTLPEKSIVCENLCLGTSYWTRNVTLYSLCCTVGHKLAFQCFFYNQYKQKWSADWGRIPPERQLLAFPNQHLRLRDFFLPAALICRTLTHSVDTPSIKCHKPLGASA